jgi:hypothetical protein
MPQVPLQGPSQKDISKLVDDSYVAIPDPLDYFNITFKRFLTERNIDVPSGGERDALKYSFARRLQQDLFKELPKDLREHFTNLSTELEQAWSKLPPTPENLAHQAGFEIIRPKEGGFILHRPGSTYYEGIYNNEEVLRAALNRSLRFSGAANLSPQLNYMDFSLPGGPGFANTGGAGYSDMHFLEGPDAQAYVAGIKNAPLEMTKSKPRWALMIEDETKGKLPLWNEFLEPMYRGHNLALNGEQAFAAPFEEAFRGLNYDQRVQITKFVRSIESEAVYRDFAQVSERARAAGLNSQQIAAIKGMRGVMDDMFALGMKWYGWAPKDYVYNYVTRMREQHLSGINFGRTRQYDFLPKDMDIFMSKYGREGAGMLAFTEEDPLVYGMKYIRTFMHEHYVGPHYERLRNFIDTKISDLPEDVQQAISALHPAGVRNNLQPTDYALPSAIRAPLNEMLLYARGRQQTSDDILTKMIKATFDKLGVQADSKVIAEGLNTLISTHYGATLAFRARPVVRNMVSNILTLGPRLDFESMNRGWVNAFTPEAYDKALREGVFNVRSRGVHLGEELRARLLEEAPITGKNWFLGGLYRTFLVDGMPANLTRTLTEKGLSGINSTDQFSRIWAAESQEAFIRPKVEAFLNGKLTEEQLRAKGLPYWENSIKDRFMEILNKDGSEKAIRYIRKASSDATNYIYGAMANPAFAQGATGRLTFAYGTWPLWYKDLLFRTFRNANGLGEHAALLARYSIAAGALSAVGLQFGLDMKGWMAHNSVLSYGGGPLVRVVADASAAMASGSWEQKADGFGTLVQNNVMRNFFPGQLLLSDVQQSLNEMPYPSRAITSFMLGRHTDDIRSWGNDIMKQYDSVGAFGSPQTPPQSGP